MILEDQVSSREPSQRLKELGVKQESCFYHVEKQSGKWIILDSDFYNDPAFFTGYKKPVFSAFTVAELGEMLPASSQWFPVKQFDGKWSALNLKAEPIAYENSEADARAKMLIYLIEQGLVKP